MDGPALQPPRLILVGSVPEIRSNARLALIALAALIPLAPILTGASLLSARTTSAPAGAALRPLLPTPPVTLTEQTQARRRIGSTVARVIRATTLDSSAGGPTLAPQPVTTTFGSPTVLLVRRTIPGWVGVLTPLAGNGKLGWIHSGDVSLTTVNWSIKVSLTHRKLTVLEGHRVMVRYPIAIGRPTAPTPTGSFAVTDRLETGDPSGPYGCCIIATSALAPHAIQDWDGGDRIAIHATPDTSTIGEAVSHGCMHVTGPEGQWLIDHVPLGTPVDVRD